MAEENFVYKTLDKLLDVIEVELKLPLGIAEVKMSPTAIAKEWRENQKKRNELENAIQRAEENFVGEHKDQKVAQMLHELPLFSEEEFKHVIVGLLTHLNEKEITWLAEVKLTKTWGNVASTEEIRKALMSYLPYLRHELNGIKEFREVISALALERIDENTQETVETTRRIESKLDKVLDTHTPKGKEEPDFWFIPHPYPMPPNFTGRVDEQKMLDDWLADSTNRLFTLRALGGFGKSSLAWQWITTHVNPAEWTKLVFWSFYEGDASFAHFIEETLKYLKLDIPQGERPQVDELLKAMQTQKILLIMDGFERVLRLYANMNAAYQSDEEQKIEDTQLDCVNISAEFFLRGVCSLPNIKSKILMTTRHFPRAIKPRGEFMLGCREEELNSMQKADAVEFFRKQKIKGTHTEIEAACASYGYHPLSLRLLAGRILKDFANPADIIVAQKLKIDGDLKAHQHHVLEVSYNSLPNHEQKLLSTIACSRSSVEFKMIEVIAENKDTIDNDLHDLIERGLLHFDEKNKKFDLHPIVRRYVYDHLIDRERRNIHVQLVMHFIDIMPLTNKNVKKLEDLASVIELYHHMVRAGKFDEARVLFYDRLTNAMYFQFGAYQQIIELLTALFLDGEDELPRLIDESAQAWILNMLANAYSSNGQPRRAITVLITALAIAEKLREKRNLAIGLGNLANRNKDIGALRKAEDGLRREIGISYEIENELTEANARYNLARVLSYCGKWDESKQEQEKGLSLVKKLSKTQAESTILSNRALHFVLMTREQLSVNNNNRSVTDYAELAIESAERALELTNEQAKDIPIPRDYIDAYRILGAAYLMKRELDKAEENLSKAISVCRQINLVESEADILLELARLRYDQKKTEEAKSLADEALLITERCGYVLQGADVNLFLAQYALEQEQDKVKAKQYAEEAKELATCDGPPYYYKVAYEEAERMLKDLA